MSYVDDFDAIPTVGNSPKIAAPGNGMGSNDKRLTILNDELSRATDPKDRAMIQSQIAAYGGGKGAGVMVSVPSTPTVSKYVKDFDAVPVLPDPVQTSPKKNGSDTSGAWKGAYPELNTTSGTVTLPQQYKDPVPHDNQAYATLNGPRDAWNWFASNPVAAIKNASAPVISELTNAGNDIAVHPTHLATAPVEAALNLGTGLLSTSAGGLLALGTVATGGRLQDALDRLYATQQAGTYHPRTQLGQFTAENNPVSLGARAVQGAGNAVGNVVNSAVSGLGLSPNDAAVAATLADMGIQGFAPFAANRAFKGGKLVPVQNSDVIAANSGHSSAFKDNTVGAMQAGQSLGMSPLKPAAIATGEITPESRSTHAITPADVVERAEILKRVGVEETRKSAVDADPLAASSDYQTTRVDSPAGRRMLAGFNAERNALETHAQGIVNDTGGTLGTDQSTLYARGNTILQPLDSLKEWYDNGIRKLYVQANERAQGQPVTLDETNKLLSTKSNFTGNSDTLALKNGVTDRMQELGMLDDKGNLTSSTVDQAENLRKYLNEQWSPKNSHIIGQLKDSLDSDVSKGAGEDIYQEARALRAKRAEMLDDPRGIANIMDSSGPSGINRKVDIEKIPTAITSMSVDQFRHVINQLKSVPDELQPQAQAALAEIKAHFANQLHDVGAMTKGHWNAGGVNKFLKNNAERMGVLFGDDPDMLGKIHDLRDAGNILSYNSAYPGAAAQTHNLLQRGAVATGAGVGGSVGAAVGGGLGAAIGTPVGAGVGSRAADAIGLRNANKRFVKLSEMAGLAKSK